MERKTILNDTPASRLRWPLRQVRYLVANDFDNFVDARGNIVIRDGRLTQ